MRRIVDWSQLPKDIRWFTFLLACHPQESTMYTVPESGRVRHPIWEAFSAESVMHFQEDNVLSTTSRPRRIPNGDVFTSFKLSGDIDQIKKLTLHVGGQDVWSTQIITTEDMTPLGIEWPFWSNMQYTNMFLLIDGMPGATFTITESFRKETQSKLKAMSAKTHDLIPDGHNPFNISSIHISNGMVGAQWTER